MRACIAFHLFFPGTGTACGDSAQGLDMILSDAGVVRMCDEQKIEIIIHKSPSILTHNRSATQPCVTLIDAKTTLNLVCMKLFDAKK